MGGVDHKAKYKKCQKISDNNRNKYLNVSSPVTDNLADIIWFMSLLPPVWAVKNIDLFAYNI